MICLNLRIFGLSRKFVTMNLFLKFEKCSHCTKPSHDFKISPQNNIRRNFWNFSDPIVEAMHSEFSGRNRSVDFISTSVNEGYYMKMFWNFPEPKFLHFFIISSLFPYFNLFVSIFIQSYVNIKLNVSSLYV
jgi:hypothetical protein